MTKLEDIKKPTIFVGGTSEDVIFFNKVELLRICKNGDVFVQERLVLNNPDIAAALDEFLKKEEKSTSSSNQDI